MGRIPASYHRAGSRRAYFEKEQVTRVERARPEFSRYDNMKLWPPNSQNFPENPFEVGDQVSYRGKVGRVTHVSSPHLCRVKFPKVPTDLTCRTSTLRIAEDDELREETPDVTRKVPRYYVSTKTGKPVPITRPRDDKPTRPVTPYTSALDRTAEGLLDNADADGGTLRNVLGVPKRDFVLAAGILSHAYGVPLDVVRKDLEAYVRIHKEEEDSPVNESTGGKWIPKVGDRVQVNYEEGPCGCLRPHVGNTIGIVFRVPRGAWEPYVHVRFPEEIRIPKDTGNFRKVTEDDDNEGRFYYEEITPIPDAAEMYRSRRHRG